MTLTKQEYDAARNGTEPPARNGTSAAHRPCEACGNPLTRSQKRACSLKCASKLHSLDMTGRNGTAKPKVRPKRKAPPKGSKAAPSADVTTTEYESAPFGVRGFLDALPPEITAVELEGWRLERTAHT